MIRTGGDRDHDTAAGGGVEPNRVTSDPRAGDDPQVRGGRKHSLVVRLRTGDHSGYPVERLGNLWLRQHGLLRGWVDHVEAGGAEHFKKPARLLEQWAGANQ